ncbi:hypothetical protein [Roseivirga sp.]|uniref:hypothetical protein n=1 Tax=Roseivirga sp. TaxID=1964215 RepID=UPI002B276995|nr:hypothetical protein [Roseivirga sp.]
MKSITLALLSLSLLCLSIRSQAQFSGKTQEVYEQVKQMLESDYAKQQFPSKVIKLALEGNLPDTITVDEVRYYNFCKSMRSKDGRVVANTALFILNIINADGEISLEEKALLDAINNDKTLTVYSTQIGSKDYPVTVTFNAEEDAKHAISDFSDNGVSITSLQHMHLSFIDSNNINNWLVYYYGSVQQNELAIAFMQYTLLEIKRAGTEEYEENLKRFKMFLDKIQITFYNRDTALFPKANRNIVFNIVKEFDEAGHIILPDFFYMDRMRK